jgi:hypothetical protein
LKGQVTRKKCLPDEEIPGDTGDLSAKEILFTSKMTDKLYLIRIESYFLQLILSECGQVLSG